MGHASARRSSLGTGKMPRLLPGPTSRCLLRTCLKLSTTTSGKVSAVMSSTTSAKTHEWMYNVIPTSSGGETVTRLRQSTALADHFVPDVNVDDVTDYAHPVTVTPSDYGTRSRQGYRCKTPPAPVVCTQIVQTSELATLWESSKIIAVSDGSLNPWTGRPGFAWILTTYPAREHFCQGL